MGRRSSRPVGTNLKGESMDLLVSITGVVGVSLLGYFIYLLMRGDA